MIAIGDPKMENALFVRNVSSVKNLEKVKIGSKTPAKITKIVTEFLKAKKFSIAMKIPNASSRDQSVKQTSLAKNSLAIVIMFATKEVCVNLNYE